MKNWLIRGSLALSILAMEACHLPRNDANPDATWLYYFSCQLADLGIIWIFGRFAKIGLANDIQLINIATIIVNFIGYIAYVTYATPEVYNVTILLLSYAQWLRMIWPKNDDIGVFEVGYRRVINRCGAVNSVAHHQKVSS